MQARRTDRTGDARARIRGRVAMELRDASGSLLLLRSASNTVLRSGGELLADLLRGAGATPINGMAVGLNDEPQAPPYEHTGLLTATPGGQPLMTNSVVALTPDAFTVETLTEELLVRVRARGVLGPSHSIPAAEDQAIVQIGEAALGVLAPDGLSLAKVYNRVVFEPVPKGRTHELTLYWEIDLPYGP